jgi:hypothetical protein
MNVNGRAGIVLPHGVLTRGGAEERIREQIVKNDLLEAIIALPPKLFYGTVNPAVILILNKNKPHNRQGKVFIIDAERDFLEGKNQNTLRPQDIDKIISAYDGYTDIGKYARAVNLKEIVLNEFNLNIRRYIASQGEETTVDVDAAIKESEEIKQDFLTMISRTNMLVQKFLDGGNIPKGWEMLKIGDIVTVSTGGTPSTQKKEYWNGSIPWMSSGEVNLRHVDRTEKTITELGLKNCNSAIFPVGTVMIALAGQGSTRGKVAVLEIPSACNQSLAALRANDEKKALNEYLFYNLESRYAELRDVNGSAGRAGLNLKLIKDLPIALPPLAEQKKIVELLSSVDEEIDASQKLKEKFAELKKGLTQKLFVKKARKTT